MATSRTRHALAAAMLVVAAGASIATSGPWGPPQPNLFAQFLVKDGRGSLEDTQRYYENLGVREFEYTIEQFRLDYMSTYKTVDSVFHNSHELGFWREMSCTEQIGREVGACAVTNYSSADAVGGSWNEGTVAMRIDKHGQTQFFVFNGSGQLSTVAILDSEFNKAVPQVCTNCHGGGYDAERGMDMGAVFREFDPGQLTQADWKSRQEAEQEWYRLNQIVKMANNAIKTEAEGAPYGTDMAVASVNTYIDELYVSHKPIQSRDLRDPYFVPESWLNVTGAEQQRKNEVLWTEVVMPYCMNCHRTSTFRHENFGAFQMLNGKSGDQKLFDKYLELNQFEVNADGEVIEQAVSVMPHSELQYNQLMADLSALGAIRAWLDDDPNEPPVVNVSEDPIFLAAELGIATIDVTEIYDPNGDYLVKTLEQVSGPDDVIHQEQWEGEVVLASLVPVTEITDATFQLVVDDRRTGVVTKHIDVTVLPILGNVLHENTDLIVFDAEPSEYEIVFDVPEDSQIVQLDVYVELTHPDGEKVKAELITASGELIELGWFDAPVTEHQRTFTVSQLIGSSTKGAWRLRIRNNVADSGGEVRHVSLDFAVASSN